MEKNVLQEILKETSSNEIAIQFDLGIKEVDEIRRQIMRKVGVRTMIGLTKYVMQHQNELLK